jgi:hypothetical protein
MCVMGVTALHSTLYLCFTNDFVPGSREGVTAADIPFLCVGYGFGASFVALFMQLGGGVYTKVGLNDVARFVIRCVHTRPSPHNYRELMSAQTWSARSSRESRRTTPATPP